jgi:hypothetical protein
LSRDPADENQDAELVDVRGSGFRSDLSREEYTRAGRDVVAQTVQSAQGQRVGTQCHHAHSRIRRLSSLRRASVWAPNAITPTQGSADCPVCAGPACGHPMPSRPLEDPQTVQSAQGQRVGTQCHHAHSRIRRLSSLRRASVWAPNAITPTRGSADCPVCARGFRSMDGLHCGGWASWVHRPTSLSER